MSQIVRSTDVRAALRSRQRGFLLNPLRFGGGGGGGGGSDPYFANVSLLLHMDGANGSTTFTDSSGTSKTVTPSGNAQISTAQSKFGGASCRLDGSGDYLTVPANTDFVFGSSNFTMESWVYFSSFSSQPHLICITDSAGNNQIRLQLNTSNRPAFLVYIGNVLQINISSASSLSTNQWYHMAISRSGNDHYLFVGGVQVASGSSTYNFSTSQAVKIGAAQDSAGDSYRINGYLDDLRITKGVARYTANFMPPTAAFPDY